MLRKFLEFFVNWAPHVQMTAAIRMTFSWLIRCKTNPELPLLRQYNRCKLTARCKLTLALITACRIPHVTLDICD